MPEDLNTSFCEIHAAPRDGAAAIFGFLYQLTASMYRVSHVVMAVQKDSADAITAVFEPSGGGDLTLAANGERRAIQFKHRQRPLTGPEVATSVLPDLFRSHCHGLSNVYELQASQPLGTPAKALVANLATIQNPDAKTVEYLDRAREACRAVYQKVFGLEADGFDESYAQFTPRFLVGPVLEPDEAKREIKAWLVKNLLHAELLDAKFNEIVGHLLSLSSKNDASFSQTDLLNLMGGRSLDDMSPDTQGSRLQTRLLSAFEKRQYRVYWDIRAPLEIDHSRSVTRVTGRSGFGKSWRLYRTAAALNERGHAVVLVRAASKGELLIQFETAIRGHALGHDQALAFDRVGHKWRQARSSPNDIIYLFWEGCRDHGEIAVIEDSEALGEGVHLIAEVPWDIDAPVSSSGDLGQSGTALFDRVQVFEVLKRRGVSAGQVPPSIVEMLYMPVMCGIYATLAEGANNWQPTNEYLVLERFWRRAQERAYGGVYAATRLQHLAARMLELKSTLLSGQEMQGLNFSAEELDGLVRAGWLQLVGSHWSFAHDRLLTWALAEHMAENFTYSGIAASTPEAVFQQMTSRSNRKAQVPGFPVLGFLMMDFVWLTSKASSAWNKLLDLILLYETQPSAEITSLYVELLGSAGRQILPILLNRIKLPSMNNNPRVRVALVKAISSMNLTGEEMSAFQVELWNHGSHDARLIAVELGERWPLTAIKNELWAYHLSWTREHDLDSIRLATVVSDVVAVVARAEPAWLRSILVQSEVKDELYLAASLLGKLNYAQALPIWLEVKNKLFESIDPDNRRVLCGLASDLRDHELIPRLNTMIRSNPAVRRSGFRALCLLAPGQALDILDEGGNVSELPQGRDWFDSLLDHGGDAALSVIHRWCLKADPNGRHLAIVTARIPDRIDASFVSSLLECLDTATQHDPAMKASGTQTIISALCKDQLPPGYFELFRKRKFNRLARLTAKCAEVGPKRDVRPDLLLLLRRFDGAWFKRHVLWHLGRKNEPAIHVGVSQAKYLDGPEVVAALETALTTVFNRGLSEDVLERLLLVFEGLAPAHWKQRLSTLMTAKDEREVMAGLNMVEKTGVTGVVKTVLSVLRRSAAGSQIEGAALAVLARLRPDHPFVHQRAGARLRGEVDRTPALNVFLRAGSPAALAILDPFLVEQTKKTSWQSNDLDAISIRLGLPDAPKDLWEFANHSLKHFTLFERSARSIFIETKPEEMLPDLLEEAFGRPTTFTAEQPSAIRHLHKLAPENAVEAYIKSWNEHPERREHLLPVSWTLGDHVFDQLVDSLISATGIGKNDRLFRKICIRLRGNRSKAMNALVLESEGADDHEVLRLLTAGSWVSDNPADIDRIAIASSSPVVKQRANELKRRLMSRVDAVRGFAKQPTKNGLSYVFSQIDSSLALTPRDPVSLRAVLNKRPDLLSIAEVEGASYLRTVTTFHNWRANLHRMGQD